MYRPCDDGAPMMSARTWIALATLTLPGLAAAQSSTTCTQNLGVVTCNTAPRPGINWGLLNQQPNIADTYQRGVEQARERDRYRAEAEQRQSEDLNLQAEIGDRVAHDTRSKQAGALILDGKCSEARHMALEAGDFPLAEQVSRICQSTDGK